MKRLVLRCDEEFSSKLEEFRHEFKQLTGTTVSTSHLLREGARRYMHWLRVQLGKAKKGSLGPKARPLLFSGKTKTRKG